MSVFDERDASGRLLSDKDLECIASALEAFMMDRHEGQLDHRGKPYAQHPQRVADIIDPDRTRPGLRVRAYSHDLLEDTRNPTTGAWTSPQELLDLGATPEMVADIEALTKQRGQPHEAYRQQVYGNPKRMLVKLADMSDAFDPDRPIPEGMSEGFHARRRRNWDFFLELQERLDEASRALDAEDTLEIAAILDRCLHVAVAPESLPVNRT